MQNINSLQSYLPYNMSMMAYQNYGGNMQNYAPWLQYQITQAQNNSPYVTFDPAKLPQNQTPKVEVNNINPWEGLNKTPGLTTGGHIQQSAIDGDPSGMQQAGGYNTPDYLAWAEQQRMGMQPLSGNQATNTWAMQNSGADYGKDNSGNAITTPDQLYAGNNVNGNSPAVQALTHPDLKNRKPSLAAGWGGWNAGTNSGPSGSANYTYFSRFN